MAATTQGFAQSPMLGTTPSQRTWARIAGLMYWIVLLVDMTGMQLHASTVSRSLMLVGAVLTVPLGLGLYYAVRPIHNRLAATALTFRLLEAALGLLSTLTAFTAVKTELAHSSFGQAALDLAHWTDATLFGAFVFTIGSTIFFYLFVRSGYIPRILAWWGLFASVVAFAACAMHLAQPQFPAMTWYAWIPMLLAETSTGLWLVLKSVRAAR